MKILSIVLIQLFFCIELQAQNTYVLEFDLSKGDGGFTFIKLKNTNGERKVFKRKPKFKDKDIVKVTAVNYNPMVYHINITKNEIVTSPSIENQTLNLISSILGQTKTVGNFLTENKFNRNVEEPEDGVDNAIDEPDTNEINDKFNKEGKDLEGDSLREIEKSEEIVETMAENYGYFLFESELNEWEINFQNFFLYCLSYEELINKYNFIHERILDKKSNNKLIFEDIKKDLIELQVALKNYNYQELIEKSKPLEYLYNQNLISKPFSKIEKKYSDYIEEINHKVNPNQISNLKNEYNHYQNLYAIFQKKLLEMKTILSDVENEFSADIISTLIHKIDQLEFSTETIFIIETNNSNFLKSSGGDITSEYQFSVELYDLNKLSSKSNLSAPFSQKVTYWNPNFYWDSDNKPTSTFQAGCKPMILAEGIINEEIIPEFEQLYSDGKLNTQICIGEWTIYNDSGKIVRKIIPPLSKLITGSLDEKNKGIKALTENDFKTSLEMKRTIGVPIAGAVNLSWTTGIFGISPFGGNKKYSVQTIGQNYDSVSVKSIDANMFNFTIGTLMSFEFLSQRYIVPSINMGASIDLSNNQKLSYLFGMSIKPKRFPLFSISGGLAYSPIQELNSNITANCNYSTSDFVGLLQNNNVIKDTYKLGFYFGLGINF